jgi:hypothetical protein
MSAGFYQACSQLHSLKTQHSTLNRGWIAFPHTPHNFLHASSFITSPSIHFVSAVSFHMVPRKCEVVEHKIDITDSHLNSRLHCTHYLWWNRNNINCKWILKKFSLLDCYENVLFGKLSAYWWISNHFAEKFVKGPVTLSWLCFNC